MVAIAEDTLNSNVFESVFDIIDGITSWGLASSNEPTVTAAFIDGNGEPPLPQIVIHRVGKSSRPSSFDRSLMDSEIRVLIEVFTGSSKGNKDLDQITDRIIREVRATHIQGLQLNDIDQNEGMPNIPGLKIKQNSISFTYTRRG